MKYLKLSTLFTAFALFLIGCNKNDVVPVAGVSLAPESLTIGLSEDNLGKFDLIFTPKNASNKNVTWSSSNPEVASVSPDGIIKGLKQGQTAITATTEDGGFTASNIVNVTDEITNDFDPSFRQLLYNDGYIKTPKYITKKDVSSIFKLELSNKKLNSLNGIEHFISLTELYCDNNNLTELDLSRNINLDIVKAKNNKLTKINVSHCSKMTELYLAENQLTTVEIGDLKSLLTLDLSRNPISSLDIPAGLKISRLLLRSAELSSLNLSNLKSLIFLYIIDSKNLERLDLSNLPKLHLAFLEGENPGSSSLSSVTFGGNNDLAILSIKNGNFKSFDISKLNLHRFFCEGNPGKNGKFTVTAKFNGSASSTENIPSNFTQTDWSYKGSPVSIIYRKQQLLVNPFLLCCFNFPSLTLR